MSHLESNNNPPSAGVSTEMLPRSWPQHELTAQVAAPGALPSHGRVAEAAAEVPAIAAAREAAIGGTP